jgi:hypothetical protein
MWNGPETCGFLKRDVQVIVPGKNQRQEFACRLNHPVRKYCLFF